MAQSKTADQHGHSSGQTAELADTAGVQGQEGWRSLLVIERLVNTDLNSSCSTQHQVFVVRGRLCKAYVWQPGLSQSLLNVDVPEPDICKAQQSQSESANGDLSESAKDPGHTEGNADVYPSYDPRLFCDGGTYLDPEAPGVSSKYMRKKTGSDNGERGGTMESPTMSLPPPGFCDDDNSMSSVLPPGLTDLPAHIRDKIDLLVQNDLDLGSQLAAIDALLLEDAKLAGLQLSNDNHSENSGHENSVCLNGADISDIDKYIASMAVPPPPGHSGWSSKGTKPKKAINGKAAHNNGLDSEVPVLPSPMTDSASSDMFDVLIPPSEFNIDLSKLSIEEVLEEEYLQYVIPPPPCCDDSLLDIPIVPPFDPPSPVIEKSTVNELAKKLESRNINLNQDPDVRRAVVRPLQSESGESNGSLLPRLRAVENGHQISTNSKPNRSPETPPSSVEANPKHSALWRPEIRSADSSPVHKGKDFLSAALRGSTGTLNRRGRVPPPPPPRRSSIQPESGCSSRSESPCSTPGADAPSSNPRHARNSNYVNVLNFGHSAPASPISRRRTISTNSDTSTASSVNSSDSSAKKSSNVQKIKVLLESARLTRTPGAKNSNNTVKTGGGEQPASRDQPQNKATNGDTVKPDTDSSLDETDIAKDFESIKINRNSPLRQNSDKRKSKEASPKLRSTFKPDKSPTEMPNRTVLDDVLDCEIDLTSDLDLSSDLDKHNSNSSTSVKINPKHRSPSFQRKLLTFELSRKANDNDMDSAPKESHKSPLLGRDGVPRRSSMPHSGPMSHYATIGRIAEKTTKPLRSLFGKSEQSLSDTESSSCPASPRTNVKSFTLGRSALRGFGLNNNQSRDNSRKGIPTRVVKPMTKEREAVQTKEPAGDWKVPGKTRNSIATTLSSEWAAALDYDATSTYRTFSTFKDSSKKNRQPTFSTFKDTRSKSNSASNVNRSSSFKKDKVSNDNKAEHSQNHDKIQEPTQPWRDNEKDTTPVAGHRVLPDECPARTGSPTPRKSLDCSQSHSTNIINKTYDVTNVFQEVDKDTDVLVLSITKTLKDLNLPSCRKPSEEFQNYKDKLVAEARQFVTDSKLLVSSATQSLERLSDHVICSMHTLAKLVGHGQDVMLTVRSVPQAHNLGARLQDVVHAYRLTVSAAQSAAGKPLTEPPMKLLMKQATSLAAILSNLMKTLKLLENS